jgi:hypothetical protein
VLPGIGHQFIILLNPVKTRNMLGFVDLGWWCQPPIRTFCAVFSPGFLTKTAKGNQVVEIDGEQP